ncbi:hypothetical protein, partial [Thiolapillus sp.]
PMPFTSISAGWIFTLMGLLDDGRPLNQGKSPKIYHEVEDTLEGFLEIGFCPRSHGDASRSKYFVKANPDQHR